MTAALPGDLQQALDRWTAAELAGGTEALDGLLHDRFLFVGPFGYLFDRGQWLARFTPGDRHETAFTSFAFVVDHGARVVRDTALVVGMQYQTGTHQGEAVDGHFRGTLVFVRDPVWLLAGIHLSLPAPS